MRQRYREPGFANAAFARCNGDELSGMVHAACLIFK
jgi:hypothetical protein